jgi:hypothetical protein
MTNDEARRNDEGRTVVPFRPADSSRHLGFDIRHSDFVICAMATFLCEDAEDGW